MTEESIISFFALAYKNNINKEYSINEDLFADNNNNFDSKISNLFITIPKMYEKLDSDNTNGALSYYLYTLIKETTEKILTSDNNLLNNDNCLKFKIGIYFTLLLFSSLNNEYMKKNKIYDLKNLIPELYSNISKETFESNKSYEIKILSNLIATNKNLFLEFFTYYIDKLPNIEIYIHEFLNQLHPINSEFYEKLKKIYKNKKEKNIFDFKNNKETKKITDFFPLNQQNEKIFSKPDPIKKSQKDFRGIKNLLESNPLNITNKSELKEINTEANFINFNTYENDSEKQFSRLSNFSINTFSSYGITSRFEKMPLIKTSKKRRRNTGGKKLLKEIEKKNTQNKTKLADYFNKSNIYEKKEDKILKNIVNKNFYGNDLIENQSNNKSNKSYKSNHTAENEIDSILNSKKNYSNFSNNKSSKDSKSQNTKITLVNYELFNVQFNKKYNKKIPYIIEIPKKNINLKKENEIIEENEKIKNDNNLDNGNNFNNDNKEIPLKGEEGNSDDDVLILKTPEYEYDNEKYNRNYSNKSEKDIKLEEDVKPIDIKMDYQMLFKQKML